MAAIWQLAFEILTVKGVRQKGFESMGVNCSSPNIEAYIPKSDSLILVMCDKTGLKCLRYTMQNHFTLRNYFFRIGNPKAAQRGH